MPTSQFKQNVSKATYMYFIYYLLDMYIFSSPEPKAHKVSLKDGTRAGVR